MFRFEAARRVFALLSGSTCSGYIDSVPPRVNARSSPTYLMLSSCATQSNNALSGTPVKKSLKAQTDSRLMYLRGKTLSPATRRGNRNVP
ncbi:uncharacterized protein HD556DRAFT_1370165, partial [Suillus plorans]